MTNLKKASGTLLVLICLLALTACGSRKERDRAIAQAKQAMEELEEVKVALQRAERLKARLEEVQDETSEDLERTKAELAAVTKDRDRLQYQAAQLTNKGNVAIATARGSEATVQELRGQLRERDAAIREFEQWIKELQATIKDLEGQLGQVEEYETPLEEPAEEPNEESSEEVGDANEV